MGKLSTGSLTFKTHLTKWAIVYSSTSYTQNHREESWTRWLHARCHTVVVVVHVGVGVGKDEGSRFPIYASQFKSLCVCPSHPLRTGLRKGIAQKISRFCWEWENNNSTKDPSICWEWENNLPPLHKVWAGKEVRQVWITNRTRFLQTDTEWMLSPTENSIGPSPFSFTHRLTNMSCPKCHTQTMRQLKKQVVCYFHGHGCPQKYWHMKVLGCHYLKVKQH